MPAGEATSDAPVIVLGCPRSGTTMLQVMLHSHRRLAVAPETRFVLETYRRRLDFGDLEDPSNRRALGRFIVRTRFFRNLGLDRKDVVTRIVDGPPTLGSAFGIVLAAYAERFQRERWGEKRPGYHRHIEVVLRLYPDAHLVHIVRDPRDVVASLKRMPWWKRGTYHSVAAWAQSVDFVDEAARLAAVTRVRYELLVADPERELRRLCAELGEEYDPAMAAPERLAAVVVPSKHWHSRTGAAPGTERIGRWQGELEPWELALCESALAARMERLGYERTGAKGPGAAHLARYAYVDRTRRALRSVELLRDRWTQRSEPNPVAARLTSAQRASAEGGPAGERGAEPVPAGGARREPPEFH